MTETCTRPTFALETWDAFWKDAEPLILEHWQEVGVHKDRFRPKFDQEYYRRLEAAGILHILTLRQDGMLAGYFLALVFAHPHYMDSGTMAFTDIYYLDPAFRRGPAGVSLLAEAERSLRKKGVVKLYMSHKIYKDHSRVFEMLGYKATDISYTKILD